MIIQKCSYILLLGQLASTALVPRDLNATIISRDFIVNKYAALGDSFASGPSAGNEWDDSICKRSDMAYGPQVAHSDQIEGEKYFNFIACSGAKSRHIWQMPQKGLKETQANQMSDIHPDMVTLSIGGNDAGFSKMLDKCVYLFQQLCQGCAGLFQPFDDCTDGCHEAIDEMEQRIYSNLFETNMTKSYDAIFAKEPNTHLFVTGYPTFFNDRTSQCDGISFKTFCSEDTKILRLTKLRRSQMNELAQELNSHIEAIVQRYTPFVPAGGRITFVDPEPYFEGHRFCEEGIKEPAYREKNTWFFPLEYYTSGQVILDSSSTLADGGDCDYLEDNMDYDDGAYYACQLANRIRNGDGESIDLSQWPYNVKGDDPLGPLSSGSQMPDALARIFHPTPDGFRGYTEAILEAYHSVDHAFPTLRVLPLGDSITKGSGSSGNGYRKPLHDMLGYNKTDFVGTLRDGLQGFNDKDHEGHSGKRISDIEGYAHAPEAARPNVILVLAGTNDIDKPIDPRETAPNRFGSLLDSLISACPDAAILVAELMINTAAGIQPFVDSFNSDLNGLVNKRRSEGKKAMMVKTAALLTPADLLAGDDKHPNNRGYDKLANAWFQAIKSANSIGWIKDPVPPEKTDGLGIGVPNSTNCENSPNKWVKKGTVTPSLTQTWNYIGNEDYGGKLPRGKWVQWADINGDGRDEYLAIHEDGSVDAAIFSTDGKAISVVKGFAAGVQDTPGSKVHFADIDGDGYADYNIIFDGGAVSTSFNTKNVGQSDDKRNFGSSVVTAGGVNGVPGSKIQLADINGDGKADFLIVYDGSAVTAYLNNGDNKFDKYGSIAGGTSAASGKQVRMVDLDGDGYADYLIMDNDPDPDRDRSCSADNQCGAFCGDGYDASCDSKTCKCTKKHECEDTSDCYEKCGGPGSSTNGLDRTGFYCSPTEHTCKCYKIGSYFGGHSIDETHDVPNGPIPCKKDSTCAHVCPQDVGYACDVRTVVGDDPDSCACLMPELGYVVKGDECHFDSDCKNKCKDGEIYQCALYQDELYQCQCHVFDKDKRKRNKNGTLAVEPAGHQRKTFKRDQSNNPITYFHNNHNLVPVEGAGNWDDPIVVAPGVTKLSGTVHLARITNDKFPDYVVVSEDAVPKIGIWQATGLYNKKAALHFADLDGDGRDDYLTVNALGGVDAWLNKGSMDLTPIANLVPNRKNVQASEVHFADLNGDGRADYIIASEGGSVSAYFNTGNLIPNNDPDNTKKNWNGPYNIHEGFPGVPGSKLRFADVNGDGRADLCILYDGGAVRAFINPGSLDSSGTHNWQEVPGSFAAGVGVEGSKIRLADIDGDGLVDYLVLYDGGAVDVYHNTGDLGANENMKNFESWGTLAGGVGGVPGEDVRFADLDGDGKADYVILNEDGSIQLIHNNIQCS